jgi:hypothetical protein
MSIVEFRWRLAGWTVGWLLLGFCVVAAAYCPDTPMATAPTIFAMIGVATIVFSSIRLIAASFDTGTPIMLKPKHGVHPPKKDEL